MAEKLARFVICFCLWACHAAAQFNLYPTGLDPVKLAAAYNITTSCVEALNETLPECDQDLFTMAVNWDIYWWKVDNVTDLCLGNCSVAANQWLSRVQDACYGEYISSYGKLIPSDSVAARYIDGVNVACLYSYSGDSWCLPESQNWTGSDVYQVDCDANPLDLSCVNGGTGIDSASQRMANLYSDDFLCNDCFVQMLYQRVTSPFLIDFDHSDYLVDQLQDIVDICNTSIPDITLRAPQTYPAAPLVTSIAFSTTTTIPSGSGCDEISETFGLTTGDLQGITDSLTCTISQPLCFPAPCQLLRVSNGSTCPTVGQYVCVAAPGVNGTFSLAPPPFGYDADAGNQQREGQGGVVTPTVTISPGPSTPVPAPGAVQTGVSPLCNTWQTPAKGLGCVDCAVLNGISSSQLYNWNPILGPTGENCLTQFFFQEYYCVGVVQDSGEIATTKSPTPATSVPGPTQTGIINTCSQYAEATGGIGCVDFATQNNISPAQLYAWNSVLGANGENCNSEFWGSEWYCVGVSTGSTTTSSSTPTKVTAPGPTQSGIVSQCNKFAEATSGIGCYDFAAQYSITLVQLYQWNTVLGPNGENCGTLFYANEWYCIGISS
ncbi:hypothetical protein F5B20DRAFT_570266 [Whalleya microplaca]|nr:hypothetical protein F5B20DRAFT_570266 [Whalleya microplaca]